MWLVLAAGVAAVPAMATVLLSLRTKATLDRVEVLVDGRLSRALAELEWLRAKLADAE